MLKIFNNLFLELHAADLIFCNWKGHYAAENHLKGDGDLDLFVPLEDKTKFESIARNIGFKRVISYQAKHDHIEHYFGLDKDSFKFVHIHVYFKIVTGEHASKNYILPLEKFILSNLDRSSILPTPNTSGKHSIFLIRYFLKIGSIYGLLQFLKELEKHSNEWNSYNHDYEYESILELGLSSEELDKMSEIYQSSSFLEKLLMSLKLKSRFKRFRRRSYLEHQVYIFKNLYRRLINKLYLKKQKMLAPGLVVAICGLDGSGKSSLVSALAEFYSKYFCVKVLHLGRPRSNILTFLFNPLIASYSYIKRKKYILKRENSVKSDAKISIVFAIRSVILAYDRKIETTKAHDYCKKGYLVICDRYPGLLDGKMDSPRISLDSSRGFLYQMCYRLEQRLYMSIKPANIIFQLSVPIEVAIDRNNKRDKTDKETDDELRQRFLLNSDAKFLGDSYKNIDATPSFKDVFQQVAESIWHSGA